MKNPEKSKTGTSMKTPFQSFDYQEMEKSRVETLQHRSPEVAKCETLKSRNRCIAQSFGYWNFGYREMEMSETLIIRSPKVPKGKISKS
jgi:hypothetical protein